MKIALLGCGYLGGSLAEHLAKEGHMLTVSAIDLADLKELSSIVKKEILGKGNDASIIKQLLEDNDVLMVTIIASGVTDYRATFLETAQTIRKVALESHFPEKKIIFASKVWVYGDQKGKWVDETSLIKPEGELANILLATEKEFFSLTDSFGWPVLVIRLDEVYGKQKALVTQVKELSGKKLPGSGTTYTNMVHIEDVTYAIDHLLEHNLTGVYNLIDDDHITKKELYDKTCKKHGLVPISWDPTLTSSTPINFRASNHRIKASGYHLHYPHRIL